MDTLRLIIKKFVEQSQHILDDNLVGIYLHGSAVMGCFNDKKSDIEHSEEDIIKNPVYIILNLCRVLAYKQEKLILSKEEGGKWGLANVPEGYCELIQQALDGYASVRTMKPDVKKALEYAKYMIEQIKA